ncbi:hypothetical protein DHEL01_v203574 [Diaporthe helianthi]|uniref:Uncharacterized protein n=1 Tax=Diaporthe helianthi TaxID=158607 RepID=A0A2P5I6A5_DIAHE|nr:hypothetical protein DHEL01_v203574 [Diaporthe helianthi]
MGAYTSDSDSEQFCEKTQTKTGPKQSYCPFVLFKQHRRDRQEKREQQYRSEIDKIRQQVKQSHKKLKQLHESSWLRATSTEQRREVFDHGVETGSFYTYGSTYRKGSRFKLTWAGREGHSVIHDLRTAKGCDNDFEWWNKDHAHQCPAVTHYISECRSWEARYLQYTRGNDSDLLDSLLKGDPSRWVQLRVEIIIN